MCTLSSDITGCNPCQSAALLGPSWVAMPPGLHHWKDTATPEAFPTLVEWKHPSGQSE